PSLHTPSLHDALPILLPPWRGQVFKAYKITDIYTREIVGYRVEDREADHLAVEMFHAAIAERGAPEVVHADSGAAMRSNLLRDFLTIDHRIEDRKSTRLNSSHVSISYAV